MKKIISLMMVAMFFVGSFGTAGASTKSVSELVNFTGLRYPTNSSEWQSVIGLYEGYTKQLRVASQGSSTSTTNISLVGIPQMQMKYSNDRVRNELEVVMTTRVKVSAGSTDKKIQFSPLFFKDQNRVSFPNSLKLVDVKSDSQKGGFGTSDVVIKAGKIETYTVSWKANPLEMFGGTYRLGTYVQLLNSAQTEVVYEKGFDKGNELSSPLVVVGEKSPYLNGVAGQTSTHDGKSAFGSNDVMYFEGVRFTPDTIVLIDGEKFTTGIRMKDSGKSLSFDLKQIQKWISGSHRVELANSYGKSNGISVLFGGNRSSKIPSISMVRAKAAGDFEIFAGEPFSIEGTNLVSAGKDARVFVGGKEVRVTQYGQTLLWAVAPELNTGDSSVQVITSVGKSEFTQVRVFGSREAQVPQVKFVSETSEVFQDGTGSSFIELTLSFEVDSQDLEDLFIPKVFPANVYVIDKDGVPVSNSTGISVRVLSTCNGSTANNCRLGFQDTGAFSIIAIIKKSAGPGNYRLVLKQLPWSTEVESNYSYLSLGSEFKTDYQNLPSDIVKSQDLQKSQVASIQEALNKLVQELNKRLGR